MKFKFQYLQIKFYQTVKKLINELRMEILNDFWVEFNPNTKVVVYKEYFLVNLKSNSFESDGH